MKELSENIRYHRKRRGLSQDDLAKKSGVSSIKMIEKRGTAETASLEAIARVLDVEVSDLFLKTKRKTA